MSDAWVAPAVVDRIVDVATERGIPLRRLTRILSTRRVPGRVDGVRTLELWTFVSRELDDRAVPWHIAARARVADYGAFGFALQASDTLGAALERASRFFAATGTTAEIALRPSATGLSVVVRRRDGASSSGARLGTEYIVGQIVRLIGALTEERVAPRAIRIAHPGAIAPAALRRTLPVEPQFGAALTAIDLDHSALASPLSRRDPDLARYFDRALERHVDRSPTASVRRAIEHAIASGSSLSEDDIARTLDTSSRTLRRRLEGEHTSLRALLDRSRMEIATERLERGAPIAALALELGFSDQTAFSRAFRRWTGRSPGAYRRRSA
jgi:AraC-like DNA-binding protein